MVDASEQDAVSCSAEDEGCLPGAGPSSRFWPMLWLRVGIVVVLAGQGMIFALGLNTADPPLKPTDPIYWVLHGGLLLSAIVALGLLGGPLLVETFETLQHGRITVESLFSLSILGTFVGSLVSTLQGHGPIYYEVIAVVLAIYTVGKAIGVRGKSRVMAEVQKLEEALEYATVEGPTSPTELRKVPIAELSQDDIVVVAPGEVIPVDGEILRGQAYVQEQPLTGEPAPVAKGVGDAILAGTHPLDGTLYVCPRNPGQPRRFDEILAAVRAARDKPSKLQAEADRLTRLFVPVVCLLSLGTFVGWLPFVEWSEAMFNAMAVLIVACPCALGLATPAAVWVGLSTLSRFGLVARQGDILEDLAQARSVVFDKTGTLSIEHQTVHDVVFLGRWEAYHAELAAGLLAIETPLRHPAAEALKSWARGELKELAPPVPPVVQELHLVPAQGLEAVLQTPRGEQHWRIGRKAFVLEDTNAADAADEIWLAVNKEAVAHFALTESLRPGAESALTKLAGQGLSLHILSGDPAPGWQSITEVPVEAGLTPMEKATRVKELRRDITPLVFVGDGVNDAPALAEADTSIALQSGAGLAIAGADAVLIGGKIEGLPQALVFSRKLMRVVRGNLRFALCYNVLGMGLAAAGILHPVVAALLMLGSSALVSGRVMRAASGA